MPKQVQHRIYLTPAILFVLLALFFVSVGTYFQSNEQAIERAKARSFASQVVTNFRSLATERHQALYSLMQNWPAMQPNSIDWFNVQAINLLGIQRGYSSLTYMDGTGKVKWLVKPTYQHADLWDESLIGHSFPRSDLLTKLNGDTFHSELARNERGEPFILYGRLISSHEPHLGYVLATFDIQSWLTIASGQLVEQHYLSQLVDAEKSQVIAGITGFTATQNDTMASEYFSLFDSDWTLHLKSNERPPSGGIWVTIVGMIMSLLATVVLFKLLKSTMHLDISQLRFKTASEAALDALLIYQKRGQEYYLVETNKIALRLFSESANDLCEKTLSEQLAVFKQSHILAQVDKVVETDEPYEEYIEVNSSFIVPTWVKIQIVRAGKDIAVTVRDVTERFKAQRELQQSEEKYRRLIDGLYRHFVYTKTPNQTFVYVSNGVKSILDIEPDEFCMQQVYLTDASNQTLKRCIEPLLKDAVNPPLYNLQFKTANGDIRVIEFADNGVFDSQGRLIAIEGIARDITAEYALQEQVAYQANHDQLTGLMNRYAFDQYLSELIESIDKHAASAVMCFIDMDRFKLVNDSCGHPAGDRLLKEISSLFGDFVGEADLLARIGGDEFCMIFRDSSLNDVLSKLDGLLQQISAYRFIADDKTFFIGASIGVIEIDEPGYTAAALIKAADNACYKAKSLGRNRYCVFTLSEAQQVVDQNESKVLQQLQQALEHDGFELYFQPIVSLETQHEMIHGEVLLRLIDDDGEFISPGLFIPLAEQHGIMNKIDWWVVENTLKFLQQNPFICQRVDKIAINLSGVTLSDEKSLKRICHKIQYLNIPTEKLCFEITETSAVTNLTAAKWFISELRSLGCRFALDDFGAGMSSFTYLKNLDVDYVKIDGSFVRNMASNKIDYETVKSINNIAHSMNKQTIAEFVVDEATRDALVRLGVNYGQGFALGYPEPLQNLYSDTKLAIV